MNLLFRKNSLNGQETSRLERPIEEDVENKEWVKRKFVDAITSLDREIFPPEEALQINIFYDLNQFVVFTQNEGLPVSEGGAEKTLVAWGDNFNALYVNLPLLQEKLREFLASFPPDADENKKRQIRKFIEAHIFNKAAHEVRHRCQMKLGGQLVDQQLVAQWPLSQLPARFQRLIPPFLQKLSSPHEMDAVIIGSLCEELVVRGINDQKILALIVSCGNPNKIFKILLSVSETETPQVLREKIEEILLSEKD